MSIYYSRKVIRKAEEPNESVKLEEFCDEYGKSFYKESVFNIRDNCNDEVIYRFSYDGNYNTILSVFNVFSYYLGYTGNIDDDLEIVPCFTAFEDYELDNYLLRYRDKNNTLISIRTDAELLEIKIYMSEGAINLNMDYYDDSVVEAFARFERHRGL